MKEARTITTLASCETPPFVSDQPGNPPPPHSPRWPDQQVSALTLQSRDFATKSKPTVLPTQIPKQPIRVLQKIHADLTVSQPVLTRMFFPPSS